MSKLQLRAFIYQLSCFALLFVLFRFLVMTYTGLTGLWVPFVACVIVTIVSPHFKAMRTKDGEKLFMHWIFFKNVKQIG